MVQHIHSFRAIGVMISSHIVYAFSEERSAFLRSVGIGCSIPGESFFSGIDVSYHNEIRSLQLQFLNIDKNTQNGKICDGIYCGYKMDAEEGIITADQDRDKLRFIGCMIVGCCRLCISKNFFENSYEKFFTYINKSI